MLTGQCCTEHMALGDRLEESEKWRGQNHSPSQGPVLLGIFTQIGPKTSYQTPKAWEKWLNTADNSLKLPT